MDESVVVEADMAKRAQSNGAGPLIARIKYSGNTNRIVPALDVALKPGIDIQCTQKLNALARNIQLVARARREDDVAIKRTDHVARNLHLPMVIQLRPGDQPVQRDQTEATLSPGAGLHCEPNRASGVVSVAHAAKAIKAGSIIH